MPLGGSGCQFVREGVNSMYVSFARFFMRDRLGATRDDTRGASLLDRFLKQLRAEGASGRGARGTGRFGHMTWLQNTCGYDHVYSGPLDVSIEFADSTDVIRRSTEACTTYLASSRESQSRGLTEHRRSLREKDWDILAVARWPRYRLPPAVARRA
jgi:hypothetical protein